MIETAIVLAAGFGTRLAQLTHRVPKVLVPFFGIPVLEHCLRTLRRFGVRRVILNAHYKKEMIFRYLRERPVDGLTFELLEEEYLLGTGGALSAMRPFIDDTTFVVNGDNLLFVDLGDLATRHRETTAELSLGVLLRSAGKGGHLVETDETGRVDALRRVGANPFPAGASMAGFPTAVSKVPGGSESLFNGGVMVAEPELLNRLCGSPHGLEDDALPLLIDQGVEIRAHALQGSVIDVGAPETYVRAHTEALSDASRMEELREIVETTFRVEQRLFVDHERRLAWMARSDDRQIPPADVTDSFLGVGVRCSKDTVIRRSVVLDGATLGSGVVVEDCLVGFGASVGRGTLLRRKAMASVSESL